MQLNLVNLKRLEKEASRKVPAFTNGNCLHNLPHLPFTFPSSTSSSTTTTSFFRLSLSLSLSLSPLLSILFLSHPLLTTMKQFLKSINPKHIFNFKKPKSSPSLTKSEPPSFGSSYSSSSSSDLSTHHHSGPPPARTRSAEISPRSDDAWMEETFKMIDLDGDGKITRVELHSVLKRVRVNAPSLTEDEVAAMIKDLDKDGDGCISLQELEAVGVLDPTAADEEDLKGAFDFFDADHDGKISAEELHVGFMALGDERCTLEDCRRMIEGVDKNNDGFVCFQDFSRMMSLTSR